MKSNLGIPLVGIDLWTHWTSERIQGDSQIPELYICISAEATWTEVVDR